VESRGAAAAARVASLRPRPLTARPRARFAVVSGLFEAIIPLVSSPVDALGRTWAWRSSPRGPSRRRPRPLPRGTRPPGAGEPAADGSIWTPT